MSRFRQLLTMTAALFGLGAARKPASPQALAVTASDPLPVPLGILGSTFGAGNRRGGHAPDDWGRSAACRRMVRKNRYLRLRAAR